MVLLDDTEPVLEADDAVELEDVLVESACSKTANTVSSACSRAVNPLLALVLLADVLPDVAVVELVSELSLVAAAKRTDAVELVVEESLESDGGGPGGGPCLPWTARCSEPEDDAEDDAPPDAMSCPSKAAKATAACDELVASIVEELDVEDDVDESELVKPSTLVEADEVCARYW